VAKVIKIPTSLMMVSGFWFQTKWRQKISEFCKIRKLNLQLIIKINTIKVYKHQINNVLLKI